MFVKPSTITFRKAFGYSLVTLLALFLLISLYLLLVPRSVFVSRKVTQYYNWFLLPGPYFRDDRIRVVSVLTISHKVGDGDWSEPRDVEFENFHLYHDGFTYSNLMRSRYERFLAKAFSQAAKKDTINIQSKKSFHELHQYLKFYYLPGDADSVRLLHYHVRPDSDMGSWPISFQLKYKSF